MKQQDVPDLELGFHNLSEADLNTVFSVESLYTEEKLTTLTDIVSSWTT